MASMEKGRNSKGQYWDVRWRDPVTGSARRKRLRTKAMADGVFSHVLTDEQDAELCVRRNIDASFGWVVDGWWEWRYPKLAPNTRATWTSTKKHIPATLRKRPMHTITTMEIGELLEVVAAASGYEAAKTLRIVLSNIFRYASNHNYVIFNPVANAYTPKPERRGGASEVTRVDPKQVPSPAEVLRIAACSPERYRALMLVLGIGGLRVSEALALGEDDIDIERSRIHVRRAQSSAPKEHSYTGETRELNDPKTAAGFREVAIPRSLAAELKIHIEQYGSDAGGNKRVFTTVRGALISSGGFSSGVFSTAAEEADISVKCTPRTLRHTAASILIAAGVGPARVAAQMGHANAAVALRVYAGFWLDDDEEVSEALEAAIGSSQRKLEKI